MAATRVRRGGGRPGKVAVHLEKRQPRCRLTVSSPGDGGCPSVHRAVSHSSRDIAVPGMAARRRSSAPSGSTLGGRERPLRHAAVTCDAGGTEAHLRIASRISRNRTTCSEGAGGGAGGSDFLRRLNCLTIKKMMNAKIAKFKQIVRKFP